MIKLVNRVYCQRSADYANDATHTWFVKNGYELEDRNGNEFLYRKK